MAVHPSIGPSDESFAPAAGAQQSRHSARVLLADQEPPISGRRAHARGPLYCPLRVQTGLVRLVIHKSRLRFSQVYSVTAEGIEVVVRTSNKKYFKRIKARERDRGGGGGA